MYLGLSFTYKGQGGDEMSQKSQLNLNRTTRDISRLAVFVNDRKTEKKSVREKSNKDKGINK